MEEKLDAFHVRTDYSYPQEVIRDPMKGPQVGSETGRNAIARQSPKKAHYHLMLLTITSFKKLLEGL